MVEFSCPSGGNHNGDNTSSLCQCESTKFRLNSTDRQDSLSGFALLLLKSQLRNLACGTEHLLMNNEFALFQNNTPGFSICRAQFICGEKSIWLIMTSFIKVFERDTRQISGLISYNVFGHSEVQKILGVNTVPSEGALSVTKWL